MIGNALLVALVLFMAFGFVLMDRLKFLVPYRQPILHDYGWAVALYAFLLVINLFAAFFLLTRRFFLKHTGQKLVYVDKQLRIGEDDLSAEIRERSEDHL
jgi:ABC-type microcin C transport system permease subunit YejB